MPLKDPEARKEYSRRYQQEHKKQIRKKHAEWLAAHPEKPNEYFKKKYYADPEKAREKSREQYQRLAAANPRKFKKKSRLHSRAWRADRPDYQKNWRKEKGEEHRSYMREYMKEWRKKHPRLTKRHMKNSYNKNPIPWFEGAAKRRALKANAEGSHRYSEWLALLEKHLFLCFYCKRSITIKTASRDHVIPLSKGGRDSIENIVPACRPCNGRKHVMSSENFILSLRSTP